MSSFPFVISSAVGALCIFLTIPPLILFVRHIGNNYFAVRESHLIALQLLGTVSTQLLLITWDILRYLSITNLNVTMDWLVYLSELFLLGIVAYRFWRLFFELKHGQAVCDNAWKKELDPKETDKFVNMPHARNRYYGRLYILFLVGVLVALQGLVRGQTNNEVFVDGINDTCWLIVVTVSWLKLPFVEDSSFIRDELFYFLITFGFRVICIWGLGIAIFISPSRIILESIAHGIIYISLTIGTYISIVFVVWKNNRNMEYSRQVSLSHLGDIRLSWKDIAMHESGYKIFVKFLVKEFAVESLLFLTELLQVKRRLGLVEYSDDDDNTKNKDKKFTLTLPTNSLLPTSTLMTECKSGLQMYHLMYKKYIEPDVSPFEINISGSLRGKIVGSFEPIEEHMKMNFETFRMMLEQMDRDSTRTYFSLLGQVDGQKVVKLMDEAASDIGKLLKDSFSRFLTTDEFYDLWEKKKDLFLSTLGTGFM